MFGETPFSRHLVPQQWGRRQRKRRQKTAKLNGRKWKENLFMEGRPRRKPSPRLVTFARRGCSCPRKARDIRLDRTRCNVAGTRHKLVATARVADIAPEKPSFLRLAFFFVGSFVFVSLVVFVVVVVVIFLPLLPACVIRKPECTAECLLLSVHSWRGLRRHQWAPNGLHQRGRRPLQRCRR